MKTTHDPNAARGLTTTQSPFIENAKQNGEMFIDQPYDLYSEENQETWRRLYARIRPYWEKYSNPKFMQGVENLMLDPDRIPRMEEVNAKLNPLTGFRAEAVSGYVPAYIFFDCIRRRIFPTTITIRDGAKLDYLPEPDIFHDVAGHVPMHTDTRFADVLVRFGEVAREAAQRAQAMSEGDERLHLVESNIKALARFFWFTVEFGLMKNEQSEWGVCAYGSGLLSSTGELEYCVTSPQAQRYPARIEWIINQYFEIDHYQPLLFVVDSFDQLFGMVDELAVWLRDGKLDNVSPGEPAINEADLQSFLDADVAG